MLVLNAAFLLAFFAGGLSLLASASDFLLAAFSALSSKTAPFSSAFFASRMTIEGLVKKTKAATVEYQLVSGLLPRWCFVAHAQWQKVLFLKLSSKFQNITKVG